MPSILVGTINATTPTSIAVGTTSGTAIVENINRVGLVLVNTSANTMFLAFGTAATLNAGIVLTPNGGSWSMDEYAYSNQQVNAVSFATGSNLAIQ